MKIEVAMPKFGLNMEEGIIETWSVQIGQKVAKGDILAEVSTDKITNTVLSPADGYVRALLADEGDSIVCGNLMAILTDSEDESVKAEADAMTRETASNETEAEAADKKPDEAVEDKRTDRLYPEADVTITPRAKKIAEAKGIAYGHIKGTGLLGAVTVMDLKRDGRPTAESTETKAQAAPPAVVQYDASAETGLQIRKLSSLEKTTARAMHGSLAGTAQTTIATEADVSQLAALYRELKSRYAKAGVKLTYTVLIVKALAMTLEDHPKLRARMIDEDHVGYSDDISIGIAVDLPDDNLVVPVIRGANLMDLRSIALKLHDLTEKAKTNKLTMDDLGNATMTVSNMGMMDITYFTPVLNPPESAILGIGAMREQVVVDNGAIRIAPVMYFSLTHDHRVINGGPAARFLKQLVEALRSFRWT